MIYLILDLILIACAFFLGWYFRGKYDEMFVEDPKYREPGMEQFGNYTDKSIKYESLPEMIITDNKGNVEKKLTIHDLGHGGDPIYPDRKENAS